MNVTTPYASICPGLEGPVLEVLSRTSSSMTGREVARLCRRGSQRGVLEALNRLTEHGLLSVRRVGGSTLYTLNRHHVAMPAVERLLEMRGLFFDRLRALVSTWTVEPVHLSVFGSVARGDGDLESDVDLLIVRPSEVDDEDPVWRAQLQELAESVERWSGNRASLIEVDPDQLMRFLRQGPPAAADVRRDAITLFGASVDRIESSVPREHRA